MESQNTLEDSKNREDVSDSRGFTVLLKDAVDFLSHLSK